MRSVLFFAFIAQCGIFFGELHAQSVEVLVLGVAQDAGHPQINCEKDCCKRGFHDPSQLHWVSSLAFSDGEKFYMIDATPDFSHQLQMAKKHFREQELGGIFLTHAHIGHYTGLMYLGREAMSGQQIPVYVMPRMKKFLLKNGPWDQLVKLNNIQLIPLSENKEVQLQSVRITPMTFPHRDEYSETVGYSIATNGASLVYIPDIDKWEHWSHSIVDLVKSYTYVLLDGTFFDGDELPGRNMIEIPHPFVTESISALSPLESQDKEKVHFIHLNHTNPLFIPHSEASNRIKKEGMHITKRGDTFQL